MQMGSAAHKKIGDNTTDAMALARAFGDAAGEDAGALIENERPGMELLARAYVYGDPQSIRLFDRLATRCAEIEPR